jgi:hypothetical protein
MGAEFLSVFLRKHAAAIPASSCPLFHVIVGARAMDFLLVSYDVAEFQHLAGHLAGVDVFIGLCFTVSSHRSPLIVDQTEARLVINYL